MTEKSLLEFIAQQISCLTDDMGGLKADMSDMKAEVGGLKAEVSGLKQGQDYLTAEVSGLKQGQDYLTAKVVELQEGQRQLEIEVKKTNNIIENDIKPKIEVLFDGYVQNASRLNRVESNLKFIR